MSDNARHTLLGVLGVLVIVIFSGEIGSRLMYLRKRIKNL